MFFINKQRLISKIMISSTGKLKITIHILLNISKSKGSQTMKFGQLMEYTNLRKVFLKKSCTKYGKETSQYPSKTPKFSSSLDQHV